MPQTAIRKPDTAVPGRPDPIMWVLIQVAPNLEVLGASDDRARLKLELAELSGAAGDAGDDKTGRFLIRPTNLLFT